MKISLFRVKFWKAEADCEMQETSLRNKWRDGYDERRHHSVWQSAPPEATVVIKAVIEWTHIFISYWFISNSPLILGGHHRAVAFLLPRLRSSAPPDITVVITVLPPRKLFTVSFCSKNWISVLEEEKKKSKWKGEKMEGGGYADWKGAIKNSKTITYRHAL